MSCPTEMVLSVHADGELPHDEAASVQTHVQSCSACAALLRALQGENAVLRAVLAEDVLEHDTAAPRRSWKPAALAAAAFAPLVYWGWHALPALPAGFRWVGERDGLGGLWRMARGVLRFLAAGQDPETLVLGAAATVLAVVLALATWAIRQQLRLSSGVTVALTLLLGLAPAPPALAAEIRSVDDGTVEIAAGERVDDDVFMSGDRVIVAGVVEGDVFAAGESVELTGEVIGNVYSAAERVTIQGKVEGSVHAVGGTVTVNSKVDGSLFLAGGEVVLGKEAELTRDVYLVGESLRIEGALRRGLYAAAERADIVGSVARSIRGYAGAFTLGSSASVGGDLALTVPSEDRVRVEAGANVGGATRVEVDPEHEKRDFLHLGFYLVVLAKTLALLLLGAGAVSLFPRLRPSPPVSSVEALRNLAIGVGVLVLVPVVAVVIAVTVIGVPIAVVLGMAYVVLFYTSTLVVAYFAGLLAPLRLHPLLRTALCLLAISLLVELPWVGDGLNFSIRVFGTGCVAVHLYQLYAARRLGAPRPSPA
jgi:anti-sigma factor RsiW